MKNLAIGIFVALIVVTLGLYLVSFQVRETESCVVTTFGRATADDEITEPGVYFKWPFPIQQVHQFDSRMQVFEPEPEETTTAGGEPVIINTYVVWKIARPLEFFNAIKTVTKAEDELLRSRIRNTQNNVIGRHYFSEFVNSDASKIKFEDIQNEMLTDLQQAVADAKFGIEIRALGIKQLKISKDVSTDVFERMKAERNRKAERIIAEGNAQAIKIRTDAKSKSDELIAAAEARAKVVRGQGDAEAAKHYQRLEADPELAMLLRSLEALQKSLEDRTTLVTPTDIQPFSLLKSMPDIQPKETN
ncbi:MAG: protease modulator HflC [Phycisphaerales bacterium]|nr:MAG: protease modulator HflC [Phycisphaerales bacterium]